MFSAQRETDGLLALTSHLCLINVFLCFNLRIIVFSERVEIVFRNCLESRDIVIFTW